MTTYNPSNPPTARQSIPSHPAPADAAATSSGVPTDADTTTTGTTTTDTSTGTTRRSNDTPAARHAMAHTDSWKPCIDRRQSWSKEDQKRELQMSGIADGGGAGFTERS